MRLTLAVPDLLAIDRDTLAAAPSLARLAHYAGRPVTQRGTLDALLVSASAVPDAVAAAPLAALGAGLDPGTHYVLRADPEFRSSPGEPTSCSPRASTISMAATPTH